MKFAIQDERPDLIPLLRLFICIFATITLTAQAQDRKNLHPHAVIPADEQVVEHAPRVSAHAARYASVASPEFDAIFYHLNLDVRFDPHYLYGNTRVLGTSTASLATLVLDFGSAMQVDSVKGRAGEALAYTHAENALSIALSEAADSGDVIDLDVYYHGIPRTADFGIFRFGELANGDPFVWSLSEPYGAREWWPCKDHPSDKADSVRVTTTVPAPLRVASPGLELPSIEHEDGTITYDWISTYPIATYLVSIAGGIYDVHWQEYVRPDSLAFTMGALHLPVVHFAYEGSNAFEGNGTSTGWRRVVDVLPVLEHWFGPYPFPDEKYGHAHVTFGGGMEHQTISSMGGNGLGLIVHELAHQWFGDLITMETWPHLWLNEGFATYSELLWWEHARAQFPDTYDAVFDIYYRRALEAEGTLIVQDTLSIGTLFNSRLVYAKGGMVLHMLRGIVGGETLRHILHAYVSSEAYRYGIANTEDFKSVAENVAGVELSTFFRQWVTEGTGAPVYNLQWSWTEAPDGYDVQVEVMQVQTAPDSNVEVFVMPVTFAVDTSIGSERFRVVNDQRHQTYVFRVDGRPEFVALDPDRHILRHLEEDPVHSEPESDLPGHSMTLEIYPNPATDVVRVILSHTPTIPVRLDVFDVLGRRVLESSQMDRSSELSLSGLASGLYVVRIEGEGTTASGRFTLAR